MVFRQGGSVRTTEGWVDHDKPSRVASSSRSTSEPPPEILDAIETTARRHSNNRAIARAGLTPGTWLVLFRALVEAESGYRPMAVSPKGAVGLGQLMPETARDLGIDRHDIAQNLDGSARYLLAQLDAFGDIDLALAGYNAGPHRVAEIGGVPPYPETRSYIGRIHEIRARLTVPANITSGSPAPAGSARSAIVLRLD